MSYDLFLRIIFYLCIIFPTCVKQHIYDMKTTKNYTYSSPEVEIVEVNVEYGFANSIEDPVEKPEQDW